MHDLTKLGHSDLIMLLEIADTSLLIKKSIEMEALLKHLCSQLPTEGAIGGLVSLQAGNISAQEVPFVNVGYSNEWLKQYLQQDYFSFDPIKRVRLAGAHFVRWSETFASTQKNYIRQAREHNIYEGLTVGAQGSTSGQLSFFSFISVDLANNERDQIMLRYLAPYLHEAMCRATPVAPIPTPTAPIPKSSPLSEREIETLSWAMAGKTNWEISMILNISERTVKFHIQNVMRKLEASSRAHAVAIALGQGLICR
jgi:DNA-binding CsgD family transcriptional regulator